MTRDQIFKKISSSLNRKRLDELKNAKEPYPVYVPKIVSTRKNGEISDKEYHHTDLKAGKTHVKSTAVESVRYDPSNNHLWVRYTSSPKEYVFDVDEKTFQKFMRAGSKGRFAYYTLKKSHQAPKSWY